ncbi:protein FAM98A [Gadus morhua]|uniref:Family with sequence similarity 98 member A n=1 Tax=Gadus morhua TaxID=8049 RepID=A0A8C5C8I5_GADMO|nr:protein FAM98A [Gadus morhua]
MLSVLNREMETDIVDSLEDLGYQGPLLEDGALEAAVKGGAASPEFTKVCAWIVSELRLYCKLEENVHATNCPSEAEGFQLEMSGLLTELTCPYAVLTSGDVSQRLLNKTNCCLLLTFLVSELEASRMILVTKPQKAAPDSWAGSPMFLELKGICVTLGMSKPPANITMFQFFSGIEKKLKEAAAKVPDTHIGDPLMKKTLGPFHWDKVEALNQALVNEYEVRRKMLLKRLDVTVQSFGWSERAKNHAERMKKVYHPLRAALSFHSKVSVGHLFAAREDLSKIHRTSSGKIREKTACAINKVLMGRVPDRGGRPCEIQAPPPEMPSWQKRQDGPQGGGGSYGGSGGGRGGRGGYDQGGRGGYERGGGGGGYGDRDRGGRVGGRGGRDGGGGGGRGGYNQGHYQDGSQQGGGPRGGYGGGGGGGGYQGGHQEPAYQGGAGGYYDNHQHQDGGRHQERGSGRGGRGGGGGGGRGRGGPRGAGGAGGGGGGGGGGWGGRGGQNVNQGGQFEQFFQQGGQQYGQSGFSQGRNYTS